MATANSQPASPVKRIFHSITILRGFWAIDIVWFHFGHHWNHFLQSSIIWAGTAGIAWMGPHQFFIMSGFVMTLSLWGLNYRVSMFPRYMFRRFVRLDPSYFVTIGLILLTSYLGALLVPNLVHGGFSMDWGRLGAHFAYLTGILGQTWYNPVMWTLGIEFQFYVLLGFIFPFLASKTPWVRRAALIILTLPFFPMIGNLGGTWLSSYIPFFLIGVLIFQRHTKLIGRLEFWLSTIPLLALSWAFTPVAVLYCFVTVGLLIEDRIRNRVAEFLGDISYSLYLIHMPFGIPLIRLGSQFTHTPTERLLLAFGVLLLCIPVAWIFYLCVERPSMRLAKRLKRPASSKRKPELVSQEAL